MTSVCESVLCGLTLCAWQMERDSIEVIQHLKKDINSAQKECQIVNDQLKEVPS